jgi:hypothetical protein
VARSAASSAVSVLALALGIGANSAVFNLTAFLVLVGGQAAALTSREQVAKRFDVLLYAPACGIDRQMVALPPMIFSSHYIRPAWQFQSRDIGESRLHASPVFIEVRTYDFDFNRAGAHTFRHREPCITGEMNGIDAVCNNGMSDPQVILCNRVGHPISGVSKVLAWSAITNGLFNRVDAKMQCTEVAGQPSGNRRLSDARQPAENH